MSTSTPDETRIRGLIEHGLRTHAAPERVAELLSQGAAFVVRNIDAEHFAVVLVVDEDAAAWAEARRGSVRAAELLLKRAAERREDEPNAFDELDELGVRRAVAARLPRPSS
jgi:hypothetical protein